MVSKVIYKSFRRSFSTSSKNETNKSRYFKFFPYVVLGSGFYIYKKTYEDIVVDEFPRSLGISLYRILPFCYLSRVFGHISNIEIPLSLRESILGTYVKSMGCNLSEAKFTDVKDYKSLSALFQRSLKWDVRPIDRTVDLVSPCDGTILHFGQVINGQIEQVKGVKFTLNGFFGKDFSRFLKKYRTSDNNHLFYCIIYLGPGDYHHFHSPTECEIDYRRYFTGKLLSVNPVLAKLIPGLFSVNERVAYFGKWKYGLFTLSAVGATNVGNIEVCFDKMLPLNRNNQKPDLTGNRLEGDALRLGHDMPATWEKPMKPSIQLQRGQPFGKFLLGSTIVLVFEAPANFTVNVSNGDKILMGNKLGSIREKDD